MINKDENQESGSQNYGYKDLTLEAESPEI